MKDMQTPRGETVNAAAHDFRSAQPADLICFSPLPWDRLDAGAKSSLTRWAKEGNRVFFVREPVFDAGMIASLDLTRGKDVIRTAVPHLPFRLAGRADVETAMQGLIDDLLATENIREYALWYFTPTAFLWTDHLTPLATIYDCTGELSGGGDAPAALRELEAELISRADLVFASEARGYAEKRARYPQHKGFYALPSGADGSSVQASARTSQLVQRLIHARRELAVSTAASSSGGAEHARAAGALAV